MAPQLSPIENHISEVYISPSMIAVSTAESTTPPLMITECPSSNFTYDTGGQKALKKGLTWFSIWKQGKQSVHDCSTHCGDLSARISQNF